MAQLCFEIKTEDGGRTLSMSKRRPPSSVFRHPSHFMRLSLPPCSMSEQKTRAEYYPALDGLRAIAVIGVILYHAGMPWMRGGFLGVETFFVISGFLITSLLLAGWRASGRIDFKNFWLRRARRLLPAFYAAIIGIMLFVALFARDEITRLRPDLLPAATFVSNWHYILTNQNYFEEAGRPPLLRHLWSLAIEWQFYMIWPLLCSALFALRARLAAILALAGALALAAWMAAQSAAGVDPSHIYYATHNRASGLLLGAALALFLFSLQKNTDPQQGKTTPAWLLDAAGFIALAVLLLTYWQMDEQHPLLYGGGFLAVSALTAVCVAATTQPGVFAGILGNRALRWIGLRSYGLYLWHWLVFAFTRPIVDVPLEGWGLFALRMAITFALTELSYRLIETPARKGALGRAWKSFKAAPAGGRARFVVPALAGVMAFAGLVTSIATAQPPPDKPTIADQQAVLADSVIAVDVPSQKQETPTAVIEETQTPTPAPTPSPAAATPNPQVLTAEPPQVTLTPPPTPTPAPTRATPSPTPTLTFEIYTRTVEGKVQVAYVAPITPTRRRIFAIGDSVMVAAAKTLWQVYGEDIEVDARTARPLKDGIKMLQDRRDKDLLGAVVVLHLGSNGPINAAQMTELLDALKNVPRVVMLNLREPRAWEQNNNAIIQSAAARYPNVMLVDWNALSVSAPNLLEGDGIHLRAGGVKVYVEAIAKAVSK